MNSAATLELALELFKNDEVSLGRAAEIAGIDRWSLEDVMRERGIKQILETDSAEEMDRELALIFSDRATTSNGQTAAV